jgi:hypothetical protein
MVRPLKGSKKFSGFLRPVRKNFVASLAILIT